MSACVLAGSRPMKQGCVFALTESTPMAYRRVSTNWIKNNEGMYVCTY